MKNRLLIVSMCFLGIMVMAGDADLRKKLIGTWDLASTNAAHNDGKQWIAKRTTYSADGTFAMAGEVGMIYPTNRSKRTFTVRDGVLVPSPESYSREISGSGVWRVEQGCLFTTVTNSTSWQTNVEHCDEILLLTPQVFSSRYYKEGGLTNTAIRKQ
jgi:hypothetical protein